MTIQILQYEFLGPINLSEWGPPMEEVVYLIFTRTKDTFKILFVDQSEKAEKKDFFIKNEKFKCWVKHAGSENNLYLAIFPMWNSNENERKIVMNKILNRYNPICNVENKS